MNEDVQAFAAVMTIIIVSIGALTAIALTTYRFLRRGTKVAALPQSRYDEQLAQLQQSMDAMALEIERIAEGQRFSTRLLSEGSRAKETMEQL